MPDQELLEILGQGVEAWNVWRDSNPGVYVDFQGVDLTEASLNGINFAGVDLTLAKLFRADLQSAKFSRAHLYKAHLSAANLFFADLSDADLGGAILRGANLSMARMDGALLNGAELVQATLSGASLTGASLRGADAIESNFTRAILTGADLRDADLRASIFVDADLRGAFLERARVHGISAWNTQLEGAHQSDLIITDYGEPDVTVDDLEVAQFIYLLLNNDRIRNVIDTVTTKGVLLLGRFTPERKAILDMIRGALRERNYVPILFDFDIPADRDITETVTLLARMARFIIADLSEPSSIPKELEAIVPTLAVPVQPLLEAAGENANPFSMFTDYWKYDWVLPVHRYVGADELRSSLQESVIAPAEHKVIELRERRHGATA